EGWSRTCIANISTYIDVSTGRVALAARGEDVPHDGPVLERVPRARSRGCRGTRGHGAGLGPRRRLEPADGPALRGELRSGLGPAARRLASPYPLRVPGPTCQHTTDRAS